MDFDKVYSNFFQELGESKKMVLSTSLNNIVTSRMVSIIIFNKKLYFQTDMTSRKYEQLKHNFNVSLCIDNIQIDGYCKEIGRPVENIKFTNLYEKYFLNAYTRYTFLKNERLFVINPIFIEKWIYINKNPYIETFDVLNSKYKLKEYISE